MEVNMNLTTKSAQLICELEFYIGKQCYNPNSCDGWTGVEGCEYRYPVYAYDGTDIKKFRGKVAERAANVSEETVRTMKYKFGTNHLFIGNGIFDLLNALEKRYGIDFDKLEEEYIGGM